MQDGTRSALTRNESINVLVPHLAFGAVAFPKLEAQVLCQ